MKIVSLLSILILFSSCDYFTFQKKEKNTEKPIATVLDKHLYLKDIASIIPKNRSKKDSIVLVKSIIDKWALKQLLLAKSAENITKKEEDNINNLVTNYKESLLLNNYKEKLIKQQLDTVVSSDEMKAFYQKNKENFRLNEELLKMKYLYVDKNMIDKKKIIKLFKSDKLEDAETLEKMQLNFKLYHLNDSIWIPLDKVLLKLPISKEKLLKKSKFIKKVDSLGVYLVAVKKILKRNDIAPLSYISSTIKQLILHKRKLELIKDIEKIILKDAIQNKSYIPN